MQKHIGLLLMRVVFGLTMLIAHGWPKLMNFTTKVESFPDPLGVGSSVSLALAVFAEVFCAAAIVLGLFTRWVSIPLFITMAVAFFIIHGADPFGRKELAFIYMGAYAALFFTGGGDLGLDKFVKKK